MTDKTEALRLALEALEETRNALAWFYDSYPQDVTKKGNELLPHVETILAAIREALADPMQRKLTHFEDKAPAEHRLAEPCQCGKQTVAWCMANTCSKAEQPAQQQEPVAWGIFHFGGKRNRKLYTTCDTREQAIAYIADRHQSDDTNTFRAAPIYTSPQPASKPWVGLAPEDKVEILRANGEAAVLNLTEAKLREKNA